MLSLKNTKEDTNFAQKRIVIIENGIVYICGKKESLIICLEGETIADDLDLTHLSRQRFLAAHFFLIEQLIVVIDIFDVFTERQIDR